MSCPLCGDECRCKPQSLARLPRSRPRFVPETGTATSSQLVDPDTYDASEEQFAASLAKPGAPPTKVKFVVEEDNPSSGTDENGAAVIATSGEGIDTTRCREAVLDINVFGEQKSGATITEADTLVSEPPERTLRETRFPEHDPDFWKQEVAARVDSFRSRRKPRPPRYPSLSLKFEPPECRYDSAHPANLPNVEPVVMQTNAPDYESRAASPASRKAAPVAEPARILEFPRSYSEPPILDYELAEPVLDRPRIVEALEVEPLPPALGGITIESEEEKSDKRPGFEVPLQSAPMTRRLLAGVVDGVIVLAASALFGYVSFRMTAFIPPLTQSFSLGAAFSVMFWAAYEYLLLTYSGSTPGLRLAGLELRRFDGSPVHRNVRRWRVVASVLSALSLGLGFAWCFLDEDALCWHDRITRTYLAPK